MDADYIIELRNCLQRYFLQKNYLKSMSKAMIEERKYLMNGVEGHLKQFLISLDGEEISIYNIILDDIIKYDLKEVKKPSRKRIITEPTRVVVRAPIERIKDFIEEQNFQQLANISNIFEEVSTQHGFDLIASNQHSTPIEPAPTRTVVSYTTLLYNRDRMESRRISEEMDRIMVDSINEDDGDNLHREERQKSSEREAIRTDIRNLSQDNIEVIANIEPANGQATTAEINAQIQTDINLPDSENISRTEIPPSRRRLEYVENESFQQDVGIPDLERDDSFVKDIGRMLLNRKKRPREVKAPLSRAIFSGFQKFNLRKIVKITVATLDNFEISNFVPNSQSIKSNDINEIINIQQNTAVPPALDYNDFLERNRPQKDISSSFRNLNMEQIQSSVQQEATPEFSTEPSNSQSVQTPLQPEVQILPAGTDQLSANLPVETVSTDKSPIQAIPDETSEHLKSKRRKIIPTKKTMSHNELPQQTSTEQDFATSSPLHLEDVEMVLLQEEEFWMHFDQFKDLILVNVSSGRCEKVPHYAVKLLETTKTGEIVLNILTDLDAAGGQIEYNSLVSSEEAVRAILSELKSRKVIDFILEENQIKTVVLIRFPLQE